MAIVKMKRLRLIALKPDRERLLRTLQRFGCVQLQEPAVDETDPAWEALARPDGAGLSTAREQHALLQGALDTLNRYAPAKGGLFTPLPEVSEQQLFDDAAYEAGKQLAWQIAEEEKRIAQCQAERSRLQAQRTSLEPWAQLDVPLEQEGDACISVLFGAIPIRADFNAMVGAVADATELAQIFPAGIDRDLKYFLVICHVSAERECTEAMRPFGFSRLNLRGWTGTAEDNIRALDDRLAHLDAEIDLIGRRIGECADQRLELKLAADRAQQEILREENKGRLMDSSEAFFLDGWLPADDVPRLEPLLADFFCAYEITEPTEAEYPDVPIKLKNNKITAPFRVITEMYSMPAYDTVDPNPLMAPFFIIFFGFMMGDIGYGIVMALGTFFYLKKVRPKGTIRDMMSMFFMCGISSIFWGCLMGSFFGDFLPKLFDITGISHDFVWFWPPLFTPINDIILVMVGSICMGVVQVFTGMAISVEEKFRHGQAMDAITQEIAWYCILLGAVIAIVGNAIVGMPPILGTLGIIVMVVGFVLLLVGNLLRAKSIAGVVNFFGDIYNGISGYFSDILSYLRLMALLMAGNIIASVFNTLGSVFGLIPFLIVAFIGNALCLVLNLLGCYVHTLRLQCLEFFGRFYQDGGKLYRPLAVETKYVNISREEN